MLVDGRTSVLFSPWGCTRASSLLFGAPSEQQTKTRSCTSAINFQKTALGNGATKIGGDGLQREERVKSWRVKGQKKVDTFLQLTHEKDQASG